MFGFGTRSISPEELARKLETGSPVLLDVREPDEFAGGHVPGAVNMPIGGIPSRMGELDPDAETLLICRSGHRSRTAARRLKRAGFTEVANVRGGMTAWPGRLER